MKRLLALFLLVLIGYTMMSPMIGKAAGQTIYHGKTRNIMFIVPDGWVESAPMNQGLEAKFNYSGEMFTRIIYGIQDLLPLMNIQEEMRPFIDSEFFEPEDIKRLIESTETLTNAQVELIKTDNLGSSLQPVGRE